MALWMEDGACPATDQEKADLDAIAALKEASAIEFKEEGNKYVKMGRKHYASALDCYTKSINQEALGDSETSVLYSNRAHVNLLLGNNRRALEDSERAIQLYPDNLKAYYRAAKAAFALDLIHEAASFCKSGIERFSRNDELKKMESQIEARIIQLENQRKEVSHALSVAKDLASAIENRGIKLGKATYRELSGSRKPIMDERRVLHWPVLLLYAEFMSSDLIEEFSEDDVISDHLDIVFSGEAAYTRQEVELYYQAGYGARMTKKETLKYLLEGTAAALAADALEDDHDGDDVGRTSGNAGKWVKVNEKKRLKDILCQSDYILPGVPVFYVVSNKSPFYREFKSGKWVPP